LDAFIQLKNVGIEIVAKTFQPLVGKTTDHNFRETAAFMALVSRSAENKPHALAQLTAKLNKISDEDRDAFSDLTSEMALAAIERQNAGVQAASPSNAKRKTALRPAAAAGR